MLSWYRRQPEFVRMAGAAVIGAGIGYLTYEVVYLCMPKIPYKPTVSWTVAYAIGVVRQHGLHRHLTFHGTMSPYWASLRRAYVMYSGSLLLGMVLNAFLISVLDIPHRMACLCCLVATALVSFGFLRRFVFKH